MNNSGKQWKKGETLYWCAVEERTGHCPAGCKCMLHSEPGDTWNLSWPSPNPRCSVKAIIGTQLQPPSFNCSGCRPMRRFCRKSIFKFFFFYQATPDLQNFTTRRSRAPESAERVTQAGLPIVTQYFLYCFTFIYCKEDGNDSDRDIYYLWITMLLAELVFWIYTLLTKSVSSVNKLNFERLKIVLVNMFWKKAKIPFHSKTLF